jgi:hypothetical protein
MCVPVAAAKDAACVSIQRRDPDLHLSEVVH